MRQIVCVSCSSWEEAPRRFAHLVQGLRDTEILFFEPAAPFFSGLRRPREGKQVAPNVIAFTLPSDVAGSEDLLLRAEHYTGRNAKYIRGCMAHNGFTKPLLWLCSPNNAGLADLVPHDGLVYDCDRAWPYSLEEWEAALCQDADIVFAATPSLEEDLAQLSANVVLLPNGADYGRFQIAANDFPSYPADISGLPRPIFGFLGEVDDFTRADCVLYAAGNSPDWSFVFVGPFSKTNPSYAGLKRLENVYMLGAKSETTLPRYLSRFDVCLELCNEREYNPELVSERLYQYLASGRPIVALRAREQADFSDVVYDAGFDVEFLTSCRLALQEQSPDIAALRRRYAQEADWAGRAETLGHILDYSGLL